VRIALLLDRDGTLMKDVGYPNDPDKVRLIPGAAAAIRELARHGFMPAVVSNQSGLARGRISPAQAAAVHQRFVELFLQESGLTLRCFYCPHGPDDGCECRKPRPGLLVDAVTSLGLEGLPAVMVGDKPSDVAAGQAIGATTVWFSFGDEYPNGEPSPDHAVSDWDQCLATLCENFASRTAA
jgi:histidinol-phosphate phosphatase family protein